MNTAQQSARVGLFFVLGLALVWATFQALSGGRIFKDKGYTLIAGFDNLKELQEGDEVRMAGVKVGEVQSTRLAGRRAEAVLRIDSDVSVPTDSTATIIASGIIGTSYVGISLGTPGGTVLPAGAEIPTEVSPDFNSIMKNLGDMGDKVDETLAAISDAMKGTNGEPGLFQRLNTLVTENSDRIDTTLSNLQDITTKLNNGDGSLGKLLNDSQLHDDLLAAIDEIKGTASQAKDIMNSAQAIVDQVKSGKGTLGSLIYDDTTSEQIKATVSQLRDVSEKLNNGEGTLGRLINDPSLYRDAQSAVQKADRALDSLNDSGPISAVGTVANSLF